MTETPPRPEPLLTRDEFLGLESLEQLQALYRERGLEGDLEAVTTRAQQDWFEVAFAAAKEITEPPARLEPVEVERGGVRYRIFGVFHGLVGGNDREYKTFVNATLREQPRLLFENALGYFYPAKEKKVGIPDVLVNGALGHVRLGLEVGFGYNFPLLLLEGLAELLKLRRKPDEDSLEAFEYSPRYHAVDPETRRGLEPHPPLPSRLEVEYWMGQWDAAGWRAPWKLAGAIVPRSMFMAGFAAGYAESRGLDEVSLVVGDYHTMEIVRFLESPTWEAHPVFQSGLAWGRRGDAGRLVFGWALKLYYLTIAGGIGAGLLVVTLLLLLLAGRWVWETLR